MSRLRSILGAFFALMRLLMKPVLSLVLVASLALNILIFTVSGAFSTVTATLSSIGISTAAVRDTSNEMKRREARKKIGRETAKKVKRRVQKGAVRSVSSVAGEAIPVVGVAVIAGALSLEIKDACETAADMAGLEAAYTSETDPETARTTAVDAFDCRSMLREEMPDFQSLPSANEIWDMVKRSPGAAYETAMVSGTITGVAAWAGDLDQHGDAILEIATSTANWMRETSSEANDWGAQTLESLLGNTSPEAEGR
ncbi:hypothetical protein [Roseovarius sp. CH_XMU1461]|uniref:hypothetical protein n=1 Tax=Roseovarius sp. CH_XMU1461 TaxID=3107777 RepID=UPI00300A39C8